jgi:dihydrofolate reductase
VKVFIIAAMSADGFISRAAEAEVSFAWTGPADKKRFVALTKKAGALVMGRKTFETFGRKPLRGRDLFILTRSPIGGPEILPPLEPRRTTGIDALGIGVPGPGEPAGRVEWTNLPPRELVASLTARGYGELAVCGGAEVYSQFLEADLVDGLSLTLEPIVFGDGVRLLGNAFERRLELLSCEAAEGGSVFLEYRMKREPEAGGQA